MAFHIFTPGFFCIVFLIVFGYDGKEDICSGKSQSGSLEEIGTKFALN